MAIKSIRCSCIVSGVDFDPHLFIIPDSICVHTKLRKGDTVVQGAYKNSLSKEGCFIADSDIDDMLSFLESTIQPFLDRSLVDPCVYITVGYEDQCNFEITPKQLSRIARLNTTLGITCYEDTEMAGR